MRGSAPELPGGCWAAFPSSCEQRSISPCADTTEEAPSDQKTATIRRVELSICSHVRRRRSGEPPEEIQTRVFGRAERWVTQWPARVWLNLPWCQTCVYVGGQMHVIRVDCTIIISIIWETFCRMRMFWCPGFIQAEKKNAAAKIWLTEVEQIENDRKKTTSIQNGSFGFNLTFLITADCTKCSVLDHFSRLQLAS